MESNMIPAGSMLRQTFLISLTQADPALYGVNFYPPRGSFFPPFLFAFL